MACLSSSFSPGSFASNQLWLLLLLPFERAFCSVSILVVKVKGDAFPSELAGLVCSRTGVTPKTRARPTYSYTGEPWASSPPPTPGICASPTFRVPFPETGAEEGGGRGAGISCFFGSFRGTPHRSGKGEKSPPHPPFRSQKPLSGETDGATVAASLQAKRAVAGVGKNGSDVVGARELAETAGGGGGRRNGQRGRAKAEEKREGFAGGRARADVLRSSARSQSFVYVSSRPAGRVTQRAADACATKPACDVAGPRGDPRRGICGGWRDE